jgi:methionyl-tRNA formyltransferase
LQIISVPSANSDLCISTLLAAKPDVVAVYGTRLLGAKILASLDCPCINYHAGITPQYRGQHPAYWASANGEPELAGVTIHLVDSGVDTGAVLSQQRVVFSQEDTIWTYQWVQLAQALPLFEDAVAKTLCRTECGARRELTSCLYFPPTIWTYINNGLKKGVW